MTGRPPALAPEPDTAIGRVCAFVAQANAAGRAPTSAEVREALGVSRDAVRNAMDRWQHRLGLELRPGGRKRRPRAPTTTALIEAATSWRPYYGWSADIAREIGVSHERVSVLLRRHARVAEFKRCGCCGALLARREPRDGGSE